MQIWNKVIPLSRCFQRWTTVGFTLDSPVNSTVNLRWKFGRCPFTLENNHRWISYAYMWLSRKWSACFFCSVSWLIQRNRCMLQFSNLSSILQRRKTYLPVTRGKTSRTFAILTAFLKWKWNFFLMISMMFLNNSCCSETCLWHTPS